MPEASTLTYKRTVLYGNEFFEIVSCEWNSSSISRMHNHGWSQCVVLVQEGVFENRVQFGLKTETHRVETGQIISTATGVEHEIRCLSETGKTLHVYVPRINSLPVGGKFSSTTVAQVRSDIDLALGVEPTAWAQVEKVLSAITKNSIATHSPYFMNQLFSGIFPETLAAEKLVAQSKTTLATFEASPAFTTVELEVVDQLCELIGWSQNQRDGVGVPGGSAANFMAVHCARQKRFPQYRQRGLQGHAIKIFTSKESHYSLQKACLVTGLGLEALVQIDTDAHGRMIPDLLKKSIQQTQAEGAIPLLVCATAGTTVLGGFDPIDALADICKEFSIWLHVDGAWGAPVLFSKNTRQLMKGIERADSLTFDAHKLFGANLTSSYFLTQHVGLLLQANDVSGGDYIFHTNEVVRDRGRLSWQCGRGADSLSFWTLWKNNGTQGLADFIDRLFSLRNQCVDWIKHQPRLDLIAEPEYLNICVRVKPPEGHAPDANWSQKVREFLKQEDLALVNFSSNNQGTFLRLILANPKLTLEHVQDILQKSLQFR